MFNTIKILIVANVLGLTYGLPLSQQCGKSHNTSTPDWRIVGGVDAAIGEFPWQVILIPAKQNKIYDDNFCGGTIINERWILTAGHCTESTDNRTESTLKVRLGVHNFKINETDKEVDIFIEKIIHHEEFVDTTVDHNYVLSNDIALIKLNESLDFNVKHKQLSPICLARKETKLTDKCVATGFGVVNDPHNQQHNQPINGVLKKVDEPLAPVDSCKKHFPRLFNETQSLCAGGLPAGGKSVCGRDSGGPLQCQAFDGRWYQVGIVSYGEACAHPNVPDVFTKVSAYVDWIENIISEH